MRKKTDKGVIVLVHGLLYRGILLWPMKRYLTKCGYTVKVFDYSSTRNNVAEIGEKFSVFLEKLEFEDDVYIIAHSMGGLITRVALAQNSSKIKIARCVMLGTPNHGSPVADHYLKIYPWSGKLIKSLPSLATWHPEYPPLPPGLECGMIVAQKDHVVPPDSVKLENIISYIEAPYSHSGLLYRRVVWDLSLKFLEKGNFDL